MNIAVSFNEKYIPYAYVALTSVFENNCDEEICVYVLHAGIRKEALAVFDDLAEKYGQCIIYIFVDQTIFGNKLPHNSEWTMEIYHRLALPELLPDEVDRVLYLDVDVIVLGSLGELYDMPLYDKSIAACKDMGVTYGEGGLSGKQSVLLTPFMEDGTYFYFNSGVLLMKLDKMRREGMDTAFFVKIGEEIADNIYGDQDILNYIFHHDVIYIDAELYNIFARLSYNMGRGYDWVKGHGIILHFTGRKPWQHEAIRYNTEKLFWEYAKLTPYYISLLEELVMGEIDSGFIEQTIREMQNEKMQLNDTLQKCKEILGRLSG